MDMDGVYMGVAALVTIFSTGVLYFIFKNNNLTDLQYKLGLIISALISLIASFFFPKLVGLFSVDLMLKLAISFLITFLVYITILFFSIILLSMVFPKKKLEQLQKKWEKRKYEKKNKPAKEAHLTENHPKRNMIKDIFSDKFLKPALAKISSEKKEDEKKESVNNEEKEKKDFVNYEESDKIDIVNNQENEENNTKIFEEYAITTEILNENIENDEKSVDTQNIIDKMGIDELEVKDQKIDNSISDILNNAFKFKEEGQEIEAVNLFQKALEKDPDNELAFWIVLDICVIYKRLGLRELAEDILTTYIDEFEDLMSEEIKNEILENLY